MSLWDDQKRMLEVYSGIRIYGEGGGFKKKVNMWHVQNAKMLVIMQKVAKVGLLVEV